MAKEIAKITVKGKYATAVQRGCELVASIEKLTEEMQGFRETLLDKENKIPEGEQSVRMVVTGTGDSALLSKKRSVTVTVTPELKTAIREGLYKGVLTTTRSLAIDPDNIVKALAVLQAAGIEASEVWDVKTTAAALDKNKAKKGPDPLLESVTEITESEKLTFETVSETVDKV